MLHTLMLLWLDLDFASKFKIVSYKSLACSFVFEGIAHSLLVHALFGVHLAHISSLCVRVKIFPDVQSKK